MVPLHTATWQRVLPFLLAAGWLFSVTVPSVTANCKLTLSTGDADALADALPVLGNFSVALPGWSETNTSQACCWPAAEVQLAKIVCENVAGAVRIVNLTISRFQQLDGTLPPSIGKLSALKLLDLSSNHLSGPIPESWSGLKALTSLDLSGMRLNGGLDSVANLNSLELLRLGVNSFTGDMDKLPLSNLKSLKELTLAGNFFTGVFPLWLRNLTLLTHVELSYNIMSPSSLPLEANFWPPGLSIFRCENCNLIGPIPGSLALQSIEDINLRGNNLTGTIPVEFKNLDGTGASIDFTFNSLSGEIPIEVAAGNFSQLMIGQNRFKSNITSFLKALCTGKSKTGLYQLDFSYNDFYGEIPPEIGDCTKLFYIFFVGNRLSGKLPVEMSKLTALGVLALGENELTGSIPEEMKNLGSLFELSLYENNFTGPIPEINCSRLVILFLYNNAFSGPLPSSLSNCQSLQEVQLQFNFISGNISVLSNLTSMTNLNLSRNNFSGSIDEVNWSSLVTLDLSSNFFTRLFLLGLQDNNFAGPFNLPDISPLISINLANNAFSGPLPNLVTMTALKQINFSNNEFTGSILNFPTSLLVIDMSENNLSGGLPSFGALDFLRYLDFSSNQLSGPIASNFSNMANLAYLDFSQNNFTGTIPDVYSNMTSLTYFNVSNNFLTGPVPPNLENISFYSNNSGLCGGSSLPVCQVPSPTMGFPPSNRKHGKKLPIQFVIISGVGGTVLALMVFVGALYFCRKRKIPFSQLDLEIAEYAALSAGSFSISSEGKFTIFQKLDFNLTLGDIIRTTENFNDTYLLGRGGFGSVYRATLAEGREFAVKRLTQGSSQGDEEFQAELATLGKIQHRNLVTLVASYSDPTLHECLLVYNFLPGGNLDSLLTERVEWPIRLNVAIGVARGLKYLHHDCVPYIIHRDMKPGNILMDAEMDAHVSDFGLAKVVDITKTHVSTKLLGTIGYLAPEYISKGQVSTKSDVFSYGVVLLQLVSGKHPRQPEMCYGMTEWAKLSPVSEVIDSSLDERGEFKKQILSVLRLGIACTDNNSVERPTMEEVLHALENLDEFGAGIRDVLKLEWKNKHEGLKGQTISDN